MEEDRQLYQQVNNLMTKKEWEKVIVLVNRILKRDPNNTKALSILWVAQAKCKQFKEAIKTVRKKTNITLNYAEGIEDLLEVQSMQERATGEKNIELKKELLYSLLPLQVENTPVLAELLKIAQQEHKIQEETEYAEQLLQTENGRMHYLDFYGSLLREAIKEKKSDYIHYLECLKKYDSQRRDKKEEGFERSAVRYRENCNRILQEAIKKGGQIEQDCLTLLTKNGAKKVIPQIYISAIRSAIEKGEEEKEEQYKKQLFEISGEYGYQTLCAEGLKQSLEQNNHVLEHKYRERLCQSEEGKEISRRIYAGLFSKAIIRNEREIEQSCTDALLELTDKKEGYLYKELVTARRERNFVIEIEYATRLLKLRDEKLLETNQDIYDKILQAYRNGDYSVHYIEQAHFKQSEKKGEGEQELPDLMEIETKLLLTLYERTNVLYWLEHNGNSSEQMLGEFLEYTYKKSRNNKYTKMLVLARKLEELKSRNITPQELVDKLQKAIWHGDYEKEIEYAKKILEKIEGQEEQKEETIDPYIQELIEKFKGGNLTTDELPEILEILKKMDSKSKNMGGVIVGAVCIEQNQIEKGHELFKRTAPQGNRVDKDFISALNGMDCYISAQESLKNKEKKGNSRDILGLSSIDESEEDEIEKLESKRKSFLSAKSKRKRQEQITSLDRIEELLAQIKQEDAKRKAQAEER